MGDFVRTIMTYPPYNARLDPEAQADERREAVVDGDTYHLKVDIAPDDRKHITGRLRGVNTHEIFGVAHASLAFKQGSKEHQFVKGWFAEAENVDDIDLQLWPLKITCHGIGKYGRWIVDVERRCDGEQLAERLTEEFPSLDRGG